MDPILTSFHESSKEQFLDVKPDRIVPFLDTPFEEVYTIVARPDQNLIQVIEDLQEEYASKDSDQYVYSKDRLHMTILGDIPVSLNQSNLKTIFREGLKTKLQCKVWGTASNPSASSISLYPENFSFHTLREELRDDLQAHGTDFSKYIKTYEYVGWINILRYIFSPKQELLDSIESYLEKDFGTFEFNTFQLLRVSNLVLSPERTTVVDEVRLN